jgi:hypothetical protein
MVRSCRRQIAFRVIAVDARRQAPPRKYTESCRSERGDVTGVPSYALSAGGREGGFTGAAVGRPIMRKIGIFWRTSMKPYGRDANNLGDVLWITAVLASHADFVADSRAFVWRQVA